jgi:GntR family transcriptional repressor for pyruvate dehydrogenase complex
MVHLNEKRKEVIEKILYKIRNGEIAINGKLLPERQLAEAIGESRPVLREGLIALEAMGVLDIRERQGIYFSSREENDAKMMLQKVRGWPADVLSRVMEVRQIIEPLATGLAAARRNDKDLMKMRECLEFMKELVDQTSEEAAKKGAYYNTAFHTVIVESADNAYLSRIYEGVYAVIEEGLSLMRINTSPGASGGRELAYQEHVRLYELIEAKDSAGAELFAEEHLLHSINAMVKLGQIVPTSNLINQKLVGRARFL